MVQKQNKWIAPALAISLAVGGFAGITKQNMVEAKGADVSAISKAPSKAVTTKPVYLPTWQGINVDDLEFFPRKGFMRYSQKNGLEYYMRVYSNLSSATTGYRTLNLKNKKAAMIPKMFKSLHTNQFRIQNRTVVGKDAKMTYFNMKIGDKGTLPNNRYTEFYDLMVNDDLSDKQQYWLICVFAAQATVHEAITKYLQDGKPDYAEKTWKNYEKFYNPNFSIQKEASFNRMINVLSDMEGFNEPERSKFKQILLDQLKIAEAESKVYNAQFTFNKQKYTIQSSNNALIFTIKRL